MSELYYIYIKYQHRFSLWMIKSISKLYYVYIKYQHAFSLWMIKSISKLHYVYIKYQQPVLFMDDKIHE